VGADRQEAAMADLGGPEIIVIIVAVALLFGWKRMPDMARSLGRSVRIFKSEVDEMRTGGMADAAAVLPTSAPTATATPTATPTLAEPVTRTPASSSEKSPADPA
jgi:sec-independent protein translocase protein TatA